MAGQEGTVPADGRPVSPRDRDVLLLTTLGRKSGWEHTVFPQSFPDGKNTVLVAANSGRVSHPDWYHNLKAAPTGRVEIMGRTLPVRAAELSADEAAEFRPRILRRVPNYARYQKAAGRAIPLLRFVPVRPVQGGARS